MIQVTRLNHTHVVLNCELIEQIDANPDTVISLTTGQKVMVLESTEEIVRRVMEYKHHIHSPQGMPWTGPLTCQMENSTNGKT